LESVVTIYNAGWEKVRDRTLRERDWTCERCGDRHLLNMHVHHLTYDRVGGAELASDLMVLCKGCHYEEHHRR
jgi:5-methylcytosine-specific restriction endonuclease McrA